MMIFIKLVTLIIMCIILMVGMLVLIGGIGIIYDKIGEKSSKDIHIMIPIITTILAVALYLSGAVMLMDWFNNIWWHF